MENNHRGGGDETEEDDESSLMGGIGADENDGDQDQYDKQDVEDEPMQQKAETEDSTSNSRQSHNHDGGDDDGGEEDVEENVEENGDDSGEPGAHNLTTSGKMEIGDCDENDNESKHSSAGSVTPAHVKELRQEQLDSYLNLLERDQFQLNTLMVLKEREWDAILKLKKLKEIKIARLKRRREVEDVLRMERALPKRRCSRTNSFKAHALGMDVAPTADGSTGVGNKREVEVRNNIRTLEKEVSELATEVFMDMDTQRERSLDFDGHPGFESSEAEGAFLASNALKSLVKKNCITTKGTSQSSSASGKIIGEGRQGPKVDVTTLIADYRLKATQDYEKEAQRRLAATPSRPVMNQSEGVSFTNLLSKILVKTHVEKERDLTTSPPSVAVTTNTTKTMLAIKAKGAASSGVAGNSSSVGKTPALGTNTQLAKLLSTNNGNSVSRSLEESAMYNHKAASNNSAGSEKNLSLANLLASSKSRDEPPKKKASDAGNVPVCQGCHSNKAQFVCAGCANQWYCSRECQVAAWDDHSEVCTG